MDNIFVSAGFVIGITEVFKRAFKIPSRAIPLTALAVGMIISGFVAGWGTLAILNGVLTGLISQGLWDTGKSVVK